jgi:hypothetical protein
VRPHLLVLFMLTWSISVLGQNSFRKNDLYFEFLGNGIWSSISYERQLKNEPGWALRFGVGYFSGDDKFRITLPIGINYLFKLRHINSFLDAGLGGTWSEAAGLMKDLPSGERDYTEHIWSIVPSIGYRRHTKGNFMWRASFTPFINKYRFMPSLGVSLGKRF